MKTTKLLSLVALMLVPVLANAQWVHDDTFQAHLDTIPSVHGVAVDPDGKVWVQSYYATEQHITADNDTLSLRALYVYNPDGTQADYSPISFVEYPSSTELPIDTLYNSGRGITSNLGNGNIVVATYNDLIVIDYKTGEGITRIQPQAGDGSGCSLTEPTTDSAGNIYVGCVVAASQPIMKFAPDLTGEEAVVTLEGSYSRDLQVSPDGNTIWWAGYTNGAVYRYSRADEFSSFGAADTVLVGIKSEVFDINPVTGHLWVGSGSLNDVPASPWRPQTWYAFDVSTIGTENEIPVDSIHWSVTSDDGSMFDAARPRGLDFSADGMAAYISALSAANGIQKHMKSDGNSNEVVNQLPNGYALDQNYPNPFNPTTNINYSLQKAGHVTLKVYDMTGREIATLVNGRMNAGAHTVTFNASNLSSGVYIYALEANGVRLTNRMTLIK